MAASSTADSSSIMPGGVERALLRDRTVMRATLIGVAAFEGLIGFFYLAVGIGVYAVSPVDFLTRVYFGFSPGAAAFLAALLGLSAFGGFLHSVLKLSFFDDVLPPGLRYRAPCRCRVLGLLMLLVLVQTVFMGLGLATVLKSFSDYADGDTGRTGIDAVEAVALGDIVGRVVFFVVFLMVSIRIAHLWGNTVHTWRVATVRGISTTPGERSVGRVTKVHRVADASGSTTSTGDAGSGGSGVAAVTEGAYVAVTVDGTAQLPELASSPTSARSRGSDSVASVGSAAAAAAQLELAALAFGDAAEVADGLFELQQEFTDEQEFAARWRELPTTGMFVVPVAVPAAARLEEAVARHLQGQGFEVVGQGTVRGVFRLCFVGRHGGGDGIAGGARTAFCLGKLDVAADAALLQGMSSDDDDGEGGDGGGVSTGRREARARQLTAEFKVSPAALQPAFVRSLQLGRVLQREEATGSL